MEFLKTSPLDGSAIVTLSDGTKVGIPNLKEPPAVTAQEIRIVVRRLLKVVENLDKRLAVVEGRSGPSQVELRGLEPPT
jgi:hypothetical protein